MQGEDVLKRGNLQRVQRKTWHDSRTQTNWVQIPALTINCELAGDVVSLSFLTCETRLFFL